MSFPKPFLFILFSLFIYQQAFAQNTFAKIYWLNKGSHMDGAGVSTHDGGYVLTGSTGATNKAPRAIVLIKLNTHGDTIWTRNFTIPDSDEVIFDVIETHDRGFIMTGRRETVSIVGDDKILVVKTDSLGKLEWQRTYGLPPVSFNTQYGCRVIESIDSTYMVLSNDDEGEQFGDPHIYLQKIDKKGNLIWTYAGIEGYLPRGIVQTPYDSGFVVTGATLSSLTAHPEGAMLVKISKKGQYLWSKILTRSKKITIYSDFADNLALMPDSGFMVVGTTASAYEGPGKLFMMRTHKNGDTAWIKYDTKPYDSVVVNDMVHTPSGSFVISGYMIDSADNGLGYNWYVFIMKIDSNGNVVFAKRYQWTDITKGNRISICKDGGFYITGDFGGSHLLAIKTDSLGNIPDCHSFLSDWGSDSVQRCSYDSFTEMPAVVNPQLYTFQWYKNDTLIPGAKKYGFVPKNTGYYKVIVTDSHGCADTSLTRHFRFIPAPVANAGNDDTTCYWLGYYNFAGSPPGGRWAGPGLQNGNTQLQFGSLKPGRYPYVYSVSTSLCQVFDSMWLTIDTVKPKPPTIIAKGGTSFCAGDTAVLTALGTGYKFYMWNKGYSQGNEDKVTFPAQIYVQGIGRNGCYSDTSNKITLKIIYPPAKPAIISYSKDSLKSNSTAKYYEWSRDGVVLSDTDFAIRATQTGKYELRIKDELCFSPYADPLPFTITGIMSSSDQNAISLYPNPVSNLLNIKSGQVFMGIQNIKIYDLTGQVVWEDLNMPLSPGEQQIDVHALLPGMYYLQIMSGDKQVRLLFVKE